MIRLLVFLAPLLLLLPSADAFAQQRPPRRGKPGFHGPRHGPPPGRFPPGRRPCNNPGGCSLEDLMGDVQDAAETSEEVELTDGGDHQGASTSDADSLSDFPNNDSHANIKAMLEWAAEEYGIPERLLMATAWTESKWAQWKSDGSVLVGGGVDYGLMQINEDTWSGTYDWSKIEGDVRENVKAGAEILQWSYNYAKSKGYTGDDLAKAAYAVYNGGPDAVHRPWDTSSAWRQNDLNFESYYDNRSWESNS